MTSKTIRDYPIQEINPFTDETYVSKNNTFSVTVVKNNDKTAINLTSLCKVGKAGDMPKIIGKILKNKLRITKGGVNVYEYIYNKSWVAHNSFPFKMDFDDCCNKIGYSSYQSVWYGLAELLDKNIIARSEIPGAYYLNPLFFQDANTIVVTDYYKEMPKESVKQKQPKSKKIIKRQAKA